MRRTTPSSSIIASADNSRPDIDNSTERPGSSRARPSRHVCSRMSVSDALCRASEIVRPANSGRRYSRSAKISRGDIFVSPDEIADRQREGRILGHGKRIDTEIVFEPRHQDRKRKRIEARFMEREIILEGRKRDLLLFGDLLHCRENRRSYRHLLPRLFIKFVVAKHRTKI